MGPGKFHKRSTHSVYSICFTKSANNISTTIKSRRCIARACRTKYQQSNLGMLCVCVLDTRDSLRERSPFDALLYILLTTLSSNREYFQYKVKKEERAVPTAARAAAAAAVKKKPPATSICKEKRHSLADVFSSISFLFVSLFRYRIEILRHADDSAKQKPYDSKLPGACFFLLRPPFPER